MTLLVDLYGRQSQCNDRSIAQQLGIGRRRADTQQWTVHGVYSDGISASPYATKERDDWPRLVANVQHGRTNIVWLWESSRGDRRASTWLQFLEACEERDVKIYVETHGRLYDMDNPRDWRTLAEDGTDNQYEAAKTRLRTRRDAAESAAEGKPHGPAPFGLRGVYEETNGSRRRLLNWEADPERAPLIRELFDRLRKGHSFHSIAVDWERRGVKKKGTKKAKSEFFSSQHLRDLATKVSYIGQRVHTTKLKNGATKTETVKGTWEPIVDPVVFWDVQRILSGPKHQVKGKRPGRAAHAFTTIIRCDVCGGPSGVTMSGPEPQYKCQISGCFKIDKAEVDEIVTGLILNYLSRPDIYEELATSPESSAEVDRITAELAQARAELDEAEREVPETIHEAKTLGKLIEALTVRIADLVARQRELTVPSELLAMIEPGEDAPEAWADAPISTQRKVAGILLSPAYLGEVRIKRSPVRNRRVPARDRLARRHGLSA
jgi:site-specific DNA recombinase